MTVSQFILHSFEAGVVKPISTPAAILYVLFAKKMATQAKIRESPCKKKCLLRRKHLAGGGLRSSARVPWRTTGSTGICDKSPRKGLFFRFILQSETSVVNLQTYTRCYITFLLRRRRPLKQRLRDNARKTGTKFRFQKKYCSKPKETKKRRVSRIWAKRAFSESKLRCRNRAQPDYQQKATTQLYMRARL